MRSFVPKYHTMDRPWTAPYWVKNSPGTKGVNAHVFYPVVEPIKVSFRETLLLLFVIVCNICHIPLS